MTEARPPLDIRRMRRELAFDLVVIADPRLRFADGRCLAALLATAARHGWRTALLPILAPLATARPCHPAVARLVEGGEVTLLDGERPHRAGLALVYHLPPVLRPVERPLGLRAERAILRLDQPWRGADGTPLLRLQDALRHARGLCDAEPVPACADTALRARLAGEGVHSVELWPPTTALERPARDAVDYSRRLGRHGGGGEAAWPGEPSRPADPLPEGWEILLAEEAARRATPGFAAACRLDPGELADPAAFLAGLTAYHFLTGAGWQPSLLPALAEALASGVPLIASPVLEPLLGPAALYAPASGIAAALRELTPERCASLREAALDLHARATSPAALVSRLERHLGPPAPRPPGLGLRRDRNARRRTLFLTPNGVGMGHLTRLLAVARRCPAGLEPVFLSMSQAVGVVETMGYVGEYFPSHGLTGETAERWSAALRARLDEAIAFYDPRSIVFDGNVPYQGLVDCRLAHPNRSFVWIRRGLWRRDAGRATIDRARHFDLIIEPGELAAELDVGPTAGRREEAVHVPPVVLLEPGELLPRAAAREALGLDPGRIAVLVQLGSRNNFDYAGIDQVILDELGGRPGIELVFLDWLIGEGEQALPPHVRRLRTFPVSRHLRAFDLVVSAAGYNSFHELLALALPTIFVPNENPMMDAQELRGVWAERQGLALLVRRNDPYRMAWALRRLLDPERRRELSARCAGLPRCDGAAAIARHIAWLSAARHLPARPDRLPGAFTRTA